ncbi:MAG: T9SS type A sorting domain-containing protein [Bacteroidota bacterium]
MKKHLLIVMALMMISSSLRAQIISRSAITCFSSYYSANGLTVAASAGEPVTSTFSQGGIILAQGYQQPQELPCASINPTVVANAWDCVNGYSLSVSATGLPSGSTYLWSNGQTSSTINNLFAGNYAVTITTSPGCILAASYTLQTPAPYNTYTQGIWGANTPSVGSVAAYMYANFSTVFPAPEYLTVGCTRKLRLTSAQAVNAFLPSSGTPKALPAGTTVNPGASLANTLAGQVVALTLNVKFDLFNPAFNPASLALGNLVITSGSFAGKSVNWVLNEASRKLGGCSSPYTFAQLNNICTQINQNYQNGTNAGLLTCSGSTVRLSNAEPAEELLVFPNPTAGEINIVINEPVSGDLLVTIADLSGKTLFRKTIAAEGENFSLQIPAAESNLLPGMYIVVVDRNDTRSFARIVVSR